MEFRSKQAAIGHFRKTGTVHAHIDAGGHHLIERVKTMARDLDASGFPSKCNSIMDSFQGSYRQHEDFRLTYANHTPWAQNAEQFDVFSTTSFQNGKWGQVASTLKLILEKFSDIHGVVVEVEKVLGVIVKNGTWKRPLSLIPSINETEVGYEALSTHPLEIHMAFDLAKERWTLNGEPSISLEKVCRETEQRGLKVGEWFLFDKDTHWSFRSSRFLEIDGFEEIARDCHILMQECLREMFAEEIRSWTLVEQILGLWKTQISRPIKYRKGKGGKIVRQFGTELTLPQLGMWEQSFLTLRTFWGIAPNFLGDTNPEIYDAMLSNLKERNTVYTYFLHSFADLQRLRDFTKRLAQQLGRPDLSEQIRPVLLWKRPGDRSSDGVMRREYFIANPDLKKREGYRIMRNNSGYVTRGIRLLEIECNRVVELLLPLLDHPIQGICPPAIVKDSHESGLAIAYTDLEDSVTLMHKTPAATWDQMLEDYDRLVATETSRVGGEVVKALGDGYLLAFPNPKAAFDFAVRIQKALDHHNAYMKDHEELRCVPSQRVALDYGQVRRIERSHGYDLAGVTLSRCARVMIELKGNHIVMTKQFQDQLADTLTGSGGAGETIRSLGRISPRGFNDDVELFEVIWRNRLGTPIEPMELRRT
jgi:class 3 adenylate cyclase